MAGFKVSIYGMPIPKLSDEVYYGPNNIPTVDRKILLMYKPNDLENRKLYYREFDPQGFTGRYRKVITSEVDQLVLPIECDRDKFIGVFKNGYILFKDLDYTQRSGWLHFNEPLLPNDVIIIWYTDRLHKKVISHEDELQYAYGELINMRSDVEYNEEKEVVSMNSKTKYLSGVSYIGFIQGSEWGNDNTRIPDIRKLKPITQNDVNFTYSFTSGVNDEEGSFIVYAHPVSLGMVVHIQDEIHNLDYDNSFTMTIKDIDGVRYQIIRLTDPISPDPNTTFTLTFIGNTN